MLKIYSNLSAAAHYQRFINIVNEETNRMTKLDERRMQGTDIYIVKQSQNKIHLDAKMVHVLGDNKNKAF